MENKQYFEIILSNEFEKRFHLSGVEYLVKYIGSKPPNFPANGMQRIYSNIESRYILIERKSDISVLVKLKLYKNCYRDCILTQCSLLQNGETSFRVNLNNFNYGTGSFMCSLKAARYEKWQNIPDSDQKINSTKDVTSNKTPTTQSRLDDLSSDMKRLLVKGELSDVILSDGSNEFRAHKLILSARSTVFAKMFQHPMKEMRENRVTITDVPSEVLKELLTFIYTGVVTVKDMKMSRDLYMAAEKYDVKELRTVCSKNLKHVYLDSVLDTLALADLYGDKSLKQSSLDFISANYSRVKAHKQWESFMKANQVLALEVLSFVLDKRT